MKTKRRNWKEWEARKQIEKVKGIKRPRYARREREDGTPWPVDDKKQRR